MQTTETLIRSVVQEVLAQMHTNPRRHPRAGGYQGRYGIFDNVDEAVTAAREAFERLSERTMDDRRRIIDHIRRISIDQKCRAGHHGDGRNQNRSARTQDRKARNPG